MMYFVRKSQACLGVILGVSLLTACGGRGGSSTPPSTPPPASVVFDASKFSGPGDITNQYYPLTPGEFRSWIKTEAVEGDVETIAVIEQRVLAPDLDATTPIEGIEGYIIVEEIETEDGEVTEINRDYYAQDNDGHVWQLGSDVIAYEDGYDPEGGDDGDSWLAGQDGAVAGLVMPASPSVDVSFAAPGEPDTLLTIVAVDDAVSVPYDNGTNQFDADADAMFSNVVTIEQSVGAVVEDTLHYVPDIGLASGAESADGEGVQEEFALFSFATAEPQIEFEAQYFTNPKPTSLDSLHPYRPLFPGNKWTYLKNVEDGVETIITEVSTTKTRVVMGVDCIVVDDRVLVNGGLEEQTDDYFAMDDDGNLWYMGEQSSHFDPETGEFVADGGSWVAGETLDEDGFLAQPGILIPAEPTPGMLYRQEYLKAIAEDNATVIGEGVTIEWEETVDGVEYIGQYNEAIKTHEYAGHELSVTEPIVTEFKYYVEGIGKVAEENPNDEEFGFLVEFIDASTP